MSESCISNAVKIEAQKAPIFRAQPPRIFAGDPRGKIRGQNPQIPAFGLNTAEWNALSSEALSEHQEIYGLTDKEMARKIGCNNRTYENYRKGLTAPSSVHQLRCIAVIPEFRARVNEVCALDAECDPRAERARSELINAAMRFADLRAANAEAQELESA